MTPALFSTHRIGDHFKISQHTPVDDKTATYFEIKYGPYFNASQAYTLLITLAEMVNTLMKEETKGMIQKNGVGGLAHLFSFYYTKISGFESAVDSHKGHSLINLFSRDQNCYPLVLQESRNSLINQFTELLKQINKIVEISLDSQAKIDRLDENPQEEEDSDYEFEDDEEEEDECE